MTKTPAPKTQIKPTDPKPSMASSLNGPFVRAMQELRKAAVEAERAQRRLADAVAMLRAPNMDGYCLASWQDIANELGVTRQAVQQRYGK